MQLARPSWSASWQLSLWQKERKDAHLKERRRPAAPEQELLTEVECLCRFLSQPE